MWDLLRSPPSCGASSGNSGLVAFSHQASSGTARREALVCGIIGYVGSRQAKEVLLGGLERPEYRGYDSAGLGLIENGRLEYVRAVGPLANLKELAEPVESDATTGVGHTPWA